MTILKKCPECDGTGYKNAVTIQGAPWDCPNCQGRGRYPDGQEDEENDWPDREPEYNEDEFDR